MTSQSLKMTVYASLMAALTIIGAYIAIPIGPVPIVLQNMFVMLMGLLLGARWGGMSILIYLLIGLIGFPVFASGKGGPGVFLGPTGGYLLGYIPAVYLIGFISHLKPYRMWLDAIAQLAGTLIIYGIGLSWLHLMTGLNWHQTLMIGFMPFIAWDGVKIVCNLLIIKSIRPIFKSWRTNQ